MPLRHMPACLPACHQGLIAPGSAAAVSAPPAAVPLWHLPPCLQASPAKRASGGAGTAAGGACTHSSPSKGYHYRGYKPNMAVLLKEIRSRGGAAPKPGQQPQQQQVPSQQQQAPRQQRQQQQQQQPQQQQAPSQQRQDRQVERQPQGQGDCSTLWQSHHERPHHEQQQQQQQQQEEVAGAHQAAPGAARLLLGGWQSGERGDSGSDGGGGEEQAESWRQEHPQGHGHPHPGTECQGRACCSLCSDCACHRHQGVPPLGHGRADAAVPVRRWRAMQNRGRSQCWQRHRIQALAILLVGPGKCWQAAQNKGRGPGKRWRGAKADTPRDGGGGPAEDARQCGYAYAPKACEGCCAAPPLPLWGFLPYKNCGAHVSSSRTVAARLSLLIAPSSPCVCIMPRALFPAHATALPYLHATLCTMYVHIAPLNLSPSCSHSLSLSLSRARACFCYCFHSLFS